MLTHLPVNLFEWVYVSSLFLLIYSFFNIRNNVLVNYIIFTFDLQRNISANTISHTSIIPFIVRCVLIGIFLGNLYIKLARRYNTPNYKLFKYLTRQKTPICNNIYKEIIQSINLAKDCSICLESYNRDEHVSCIITCRHIFHTQCLNTWRHKYKNTTCPMCRGDIN